MAKIRRVTTVCDFHDGDVSGERTLLVIAERIYTVDACAEHKADLHAAVDLLTRVLAVHRATRQKNAGTRNRPRQRNPAFRAGS